MNEEEMIEGKDIEKPNKALQKEIDEGVER